MTWRKGYMPLDALRFWSDDVVLDMTYEQVGIYLRLLTEVYVNGGFPADPVRLARRLRHGGQDTTPAALQDLLALAEGKFEDFREGTFAEIYEGPFRDGWLTNRQMLQERAKWRSQQAKSAAAGRASGARRRRKSPQTKDLGADDDEGFPEGTFKVPSQLPVNSSPLLSPPPKGEEGNPPLTPPGGGNRRKRRTKRESITRAQVKIPERLTALGIGQEQLSDRIRKCRVKKPYLTWQGELDTLDRVLDEPGIEPGDVREAYEEATNAGWQGCTRATVRRVAQERQRSGITTAGPQDDGQIEQVYSWYCEGWPHWAQDGSDPPPLDSVARAAIWRYLGGGTTLDQVKEALNRVADSSYHMGTTADSEGKRLAITDIFSSRIDSITKLRTTRRTL